MVLGFIRKFLGKYLYGTCSDDSIVLPLIDAQYAKFTYLYVSLSIDRGN